MKSNNPIKHRCCSNASCTHDEIFNKRNISVIPSIKPVQDGVEVNPEPCSNGATSLTQPHPSPRPKLPQARSARSDQGRIRRRRSSRRDIKRGVHRLNTKEIVSTFIEIIDAERSGFCADGSDKLKILINMIFAHTDVIQSLSPFQREMSLTLVESLSSTTLRM